MANAELGAHADQAKTPQDETAAAAELSGESTVFATRIAIYDDMLSTPRVIVVQPKDPRSYLEEITNTVYRCMKEQGGSLSLMVIRELVENFIHAHFTDSPPSPSSTAETRSDSRTRGQGSTTRSAHSNSA